MAPRTASTTFGLMKDENIKAVITLYGGANVGKTTSLRFLFYLLNNNTQHKGSKTDFRIKFAYNNMVIALSTFGDSEQVVEINRACFREKTFFWMIPENLAMKLKPTNSLPPSLFLRRI